MPDLPLILVVEDDSAVQNLIVTALETTHAYRLCTAETGTQALLEAAAQQPAIMLLDLGLPDLDGVEVITRVRAWSDMPIIVISARNEDDDKIDALDAGADDYLTKPFSVDELLARMRGILRRLHYLKAASGQDTRFVNGDLTVDYAAGTATLAGTPLHLTPLEYRLLCLLCRNAGRVLTHTYLTRELWGSALDSDIASLRVFLATLRKKLQPRPDSPQFIQTHVGIGYRMVKL
ncbi:MAG: response regulator [Candidatus Spyradocola sp.]